MKPHTSADDYRRLREALEHMLDQGACWPQTLAGYRRELAHANAILFRHTPPPGWRAAGEL